MSKLFCRQNDLRLIRRWAWGGLFGLIIRQNREAAGRSVEEAARLAGMKAAEWQAVEAGQVPRLAQLRPMAAALELGRDQIATLAVFCRDAWEA
jgi:transcriptional regulator with XRE-family HTH domain